MTANVAVLLPLALTLILALTLRRTLLALGVGIVSGALMITSFNPIVTLEYLAVTAGKQVYADGSWQSWHLNVLIAMVLLGAMTQLLARGGAVNAFADWLYHRIRNGRQARLGVVFLGWVVFIDGIFSCIAVGHVCQPLSQRYAMPKEQIAYLVDSNASPLCSLLPFSSWGPYVMAILAGITLLPVSPLQAFIEMAQINFYAITVIGLSLLVAWFGSGFKSLKNNDSVPESMEVGSPWLLGVPMATLLVASIGFTLWSGAVSSTNWNLTDWLTNADIGSSMRNACILATLTSIVLLKYSGRSLGQLMKDILAGIQAISFAIGILIFTWMIGGVIKDLGVAKLLAGWAEQFLSVHFLLAGTFLLCAVMAFTTGSSWGTFAIMIPIGAEIAVAVDVSMLIPTLSAVMAGAVFGDHCSPISDTSVLSATSSGCEPHAHVITQLPFAMIAAVTSLMGYQLTNLALPGYVVWLTVMMTATGLFLLVTRFNGKFSRRGTLQEEG
ncbi:Na+/H+ antiporter NhaC family protein [Shewanella atlantica]|uniref:Sodium:proton antiporter n=1 Tax=Shewanella atlantica TaxID=271099 RepID=A0A3S0RJS5_9GAMM|nr:Na+/H+ antiporter NhaC family protein [Shewanella atlantica]RTR30138.1 sodium:proton antiporter [Shewanella atlantica]